MHILNNKKPKLIYLIYVFVGLKNNLRAFWFFFLIFFFITFLELQNPNSGYNRVSTILLIYFFFILQKKLLSLPALMPNFRLMKQKKILKKSRTVLFFRK